MIKRFQKVFFCTLLLLFVSPFYPWVFSLHYTGRQKIKMLMAYSTVQILNLLLIKQIFGLFAVTFMYKSWVQSWILNLMYLSGFPLIIIEGCFLNKNINQIILCCSNWSISQILNHLPLRVLVWDIQCNPVESYFTLNTLKSVGEQKLKSSGVFKTNNNLFKV